VDHGLRTRAAVDVHQHRVPTRLVEVGRLDHPAVQLDAIARLEREELGRARPRALQFPGDGVVVDQLADQGAVRFVKARRWRDVRTGIRVDVEGEARTQVDAVAAGLLRDALEAPAIQSDTVEVTLDRALLTRQEIDPAVRLVHTV